MKLFILSTVLSFLFASLGMAEPASIDSVAVTHNNNGRALLKDWDMHEYGSYADDGVFTVRFEYTFGEPVFEVFEECPHGNSTIFPIGAAPAGAIFMENGNETITDNGDLVSPKEAKWQFTIGENVLFYSGYSVKDDLASATFCVRYGLTDGEGGPLVNFRESIMTINYELLLGFDSATISTQAYEPGFTDYTQTFSAEATVCEGTVLPVKPGKTVCVQVCPSAEDADSIYMAGIETLGVKLISDPGITQDVYQGGEPVNKNLAGYVVCSYCCTVEFVLHAVFFPLADPEVDYVEVTGTANVLLNPGVTRRRLQDGSDAEEDESSASFDTKFEVSGASSNEDISSGASVFFDMPKFVLLALAVAGGALLL